MVHTIQPEELKDRLERGHVLQLIDVRSPSEYAEAHVPRAANLPMEQVEERLGDLADHGPIVLICQSGRRACLTQELLAPHKGDLLVLDGGTSAWMAAGLPVVGSGRTRMPLMRQVQIVVGPGVLVGALLAWFVHPAWVWLCAFFGAGLTFAGATGICALANLLGAMPWNRPKAPADRPHIPAGETR